MTRLYQQTRDLGTNGRRDDLRGLDAFLGETDTTAGKPLVLKLTKEQAQQRVEEYLRNEVCAGNGDFEIVESATVERDFGWVFIYDSAEYLESGDEMDRAVGNAPVLVDRRSGELHVTGTGRPLEEYIDLYEKYGTCHPD